MRGAVGPGALEMFVVELVTPAINAPTATPEWMEGLSTTDLLEPRLYRARLVARLGGGTDHNGPALSSY